MKIKVLELKDTPDIQGDILPTDAIVTFDEKIWLHREFKHDMENTIGIAKLEREGNVFYINNIEIREDFLKTIPYYTPAIAGQIIRRDGNNVSEFKINSVSFCAGENSNRDIETVKQQMKDKNVDITVFDVMGKDAK